VSPPKTKTVETADLSVRAAWLHYAGGYTQADVAKKLGVTNLKAHRLITRANKDGLVKVFIDGEVSECVELEHALSTQHSLDYCEVVPDLEETGLPLRALGNAGAQYLKRALENTDTLSIGIGHGRTLASCVEFLPKSTALDKTIVSLLGGFSRTFSANPHDVIHSLAKKTGASAFVMPVPFFANTIENKRIILEQFGIAEVLDMARKTSLKMIGIGSVNSDASVVASVMMESEEMEEVERNGGVGEMLGHFFDEHGVLVKTDISDRTMGLAVEDLAETNILAVAGGSVKVDAISAVLKSRLLSGLITDERTARALINIGGNP